MNIVLISTYELGRQPFGLASPAAWLRKRGHTVTCLDLSREPLDEDTIREARLIAFYVPMHTATRLALEFLEPVRRINPTAHLCAYGLYAPLSMEVLRARGMQSLLGGEFEQPLVDLADLLSELPAAAKMHAADATVSLRRQRFHLPDRSGMPLPQSYAHLVLPSGDHRIVGYTEASRGCKHLCRHCPIVPVYQGVFRIVDREVVLADIRQQVAAGARHITFGDPDFFNGIGHTIPLVRALHREFPELTYDATIKVEHLLKHREALATLRATGCLFVTSAVESLEDAVLQKFEKHHTRADFFAAVELCRRGGLTLQPTFIPFTPWTTFEQLLDLFEQLHRMDLVESVAPIQLAIRLLIPAGSRLLALHEIRTMVDPFDAKALVYPWKNSDPRIDRLCEKLQEIVGAGARQKQSRSETFQELWKTANHFAGRTLKHRSLPRIAAGATVPYLNEPWYC